VTVEAGGRIALQLRITGVKMNPAAMGRKNVPGEGHYHLYVDCIPPDSYSKGFLGACWANSLATTHPVFDLSASHVQVGIGTHLLLIALARNDHVLYPVPPATLPFTVVRPALGIKLLSPHSVYTVAQNGKVPLHLKITGISLNANAMGRKNVSGQGHFHVYVDCIPPNAYAQGYLGGCWAGAFATESAVFDLSASHVRIQPGMHMLLIALARNDHVLYPVPSAELIIRVTKH
jgi:hypothetical protein